MRAVVTGASTGIGRATALGLAADGADVALHCFRHQAECERTAVTIRTMGREAFVVTGDLGKREAVGEVAGAIADRWDTLDVLIQNAGTYPRRPFAEITAEEFESCFRLNVFGAAELTRLLLPLLRRSLASRIVFVSSILAFTGSRQGAHYAASKAALLGLARSLAPELAPQTTVNVVAPGSIDTAILADDSAEQRAERVQNIPLARIGRPEEVADAIVFLASGRAGFVTGTTLHVNGGVRTD
ncbi:MAG: SDR family NAD(P)-dependent oxidoreductase [Thermoplasmata archaeon]